MTDKMASKMADKMADKMAAILTSWALIYIDLARCASQAHGTVTHESSVDGVGDA